MINIDLTIIALFLVLTLAVGLYCSRNITSFQEYAVGDRKFSSMAITFSLVATCYGGKALTETLDNFSRRGFYALIAYLCAPAAYYLAYRFLLIRMKDCLGYCTLAESMGSIYGPAVRIAIAILSIMASVATLALQIKVGLDIIAKIFPDTAYLQTVIAMFVVIGYSTIGGARSVVLTDVYQLLFFSLYCPILIFMMLFHSTDLGTAWQKIIAVPHFNIKKVLIWNDALKSVLVSWLGGTISSLSFQPEYTQRFYMASSIPRAVKAVKYSAIMHTLLTILFLIIALTLQMGSPGIQSNQSVLDYILRLNYFPGMCGVLVTVLFSLLMSTADSNLHAASVCFANDLWPMLRSFTRRSLPAPSLRIVRIASLFIGLMSLFIVYHTASITSLLRKAYLPYKLAVGIPAIMTFLGFRPRAVTILCAMGMNIAMALYYTFYKSLFQPNLKTGLLLVSSPYIHLWAIGIVLLLVIHYLLPKRPDTGWIGIQDSSLWDLRNQITKRWWLARFGRFKVLFTKAHRRSLFPTKAQTFTSVGIYIITTTIGMLFFIEKQYFPLYVYLYMVTIAIGTIITFYPALLSYRKGNEGLLHWLWLALLFALLFMANLQFVKLSHCSPMVCALFICNLGLAIVLLSIEVSLVMLGIALLLHTYIPPNVLYWSALWESYTVPSMELILAVACITAVSVGFTIYKWLADKAETKIKIIELIGAYERKVALESIYNQVNWSRLDRSQFSKMLQAIEDIDQLRTFSNVLLKRTQAGARLELNKEEIQPIVFEPAILQAYAAIRRLEEPIELLLRSRTSVIQLMGDTALLNCLFFLSLRAISSCSQSEDHIVAITIADTLLRYNYTPDAPNTSSVLTLPALIFALSTELGIAETLPIYDILEGDPPGCLVQSDIKFYHIVSRQIVQAHGGYMQLMSSPTAVSFLYVLPIEGHKVMRIKAYDPLDLALGTLHETAESIAQERALLQLLSSQTNLTEDQILQTITFIKHAHGLIVRQSGEPYYTHPMAVAKILLEVTKDPSTLLAGLLHDVVEDTPIVLDHLAGIYGPIVASIVDQVTHYNTVGYPWKWSNQENNNMLDKCKDIRVIQVKLADKLHNLRTLSARKMVDQKRIAQDALTFYIPWGKRHKIFKPWLVEMKSLCETILDMQ